CLRGRVNAVAEGEKCVRSHGGTPDLQAFVRRLQSRYAGTVDAAHLAGAYSDGHPVPAKDNGIGFHEFGDLPREQEIAHLPGIRRPFGNHLEVIGADDSQVCSLHEEPARDFFQIVASPGRRFARYENPDVLLLPQRIERAVVDVRSDDHLYKLVLDDCARSSGIEWFVESDDAAESGRWIGRPRPLVGLPDAVVDGDTAGVRMLDDDARGFGKLANAGECRIAVGDVVVRQGLPLQLARASQRTGSCVSIDKKSSLLVRIFAIAKRLDATPGIKKTLARRFAVAHRAEVVCDRGVVCRGVGESLCRELSAILL